MEMLPSYAPSLLAGRTSCCGGGQDDKTARMNNLKGNQSGAMVSLFTLAVQRIAARGYLLSSLSPATLFSLASSIIVRRGDRPAVVHPPWPEQSFQGTEGFMHQSCSLRVQARHRFNWVALFVCALACSVAVRAQNPSPVQATPPASVQHI